MFKFQLYAISIDLPSLFIGLSFNSKCCHLVAIGNMVFYAVRAEFNV